MMRLLLTLLSILLGAALMLVPLGLLLFAVLEVEKLSSSPWRPFAVLGLLFLGVFLLVGSTYVSTRLVVRILRSEEPRPPAS
jgi:hypothetical protein